MAGARHYLISSRHFLRLSKTCSFLVGIVDSRYPYYSEPELFNAQFCGGSPFPVVDTTTMT